MVGQVSRTTLTSTGKLEITKNISEFTVVLERPVGNAKNRLSESSYVKEVVISVLTANGKNYQLKGRVKYLNAL